MSKAGLELVPSIAVFQKRCNNRAENSHRPVRDLYTRRFVLGWKKLGLEQHQPKGRDSGVFAV
jgi:hypothetical protein